MGDKDEETKKKMYESLQRRKNNTQKLYIYHNKMKVNEQFGRKMNQDVDGNRKYFWNELSNEKGGKVESCSRMEMGGWHRERIKYKGFGRNILKIFIIQILRDRLQSTCVALMGIGEATTLKESQLGEQKLK